METKDSRLCRKSGKAQNPRRLKAVVKLSQSMMSWDAMSSAGIGPLCFLKFTVSIAIYQDILEHSMLPLLTSCMEMLFLFSKKTWHLLTQPKVLKVDSVTMVFLFLIGQQAPLIFNHMENMWAVVKRSRER